MSRARSADRRALRCVVWGLACWLGLGAVALVRVQAARPDVIAPDFYSRLRTLRQRRTEHPDKPLWLVLGSSRLNTGYWPEAIEPALDAPGRRVLTFNFSHNGLGPVLQHVHLRRLLREGIHPDLVVLELMPLYLHREFDHSRGRLSLWRELPRVVSYGRAAAVLRNAARRQLDVLPAAARAFFPGDLRRLVRGETGTDTLPLGGPIHLRDGLTGSGPGHQFFPPASFHITAGAEQALRDSLLLCRREQIEAVLLLTPEAESFRRLYPAGAQEQVSAFARRMAGEGGVPLLDARRWLAEKDFADGHHLLDSGARALTRRLHREVRRRQSLTVHAGGTT